MEAIHTYIFLSLSVCFRFKENMFDENLRFSQDSFNNGVIGGHCDLDLESLRAEGEHKSALQSW